MAVIGVALLVPRNFRRGHDLQTLLLRAWTTCAGGMTSRVAFGTRLLGDQLVRLPGRLSRQPVAGRTSKIVTGWQSEGICMTWEVEAKYPIADLETLQMQLASFGVRYEASLEQVDEYFNHPARDFSRTDEALRLRHVGERDNYVTYKGPKIDDSNKTRQEIELQLPAGPKVHRDF